MGNLLTAEVTIKGVRPLFMHAFGEDSIPLEKGERTGVAGNDPEEWRKTVLVTKAGQLYLHGTCVFSALAGKDGAAKYTKKGRGTLLNPLRATLQVTDDRIMLDRVMPSANGTYDAKTAPPPSRDPEEPVYLDVRGCVNPANRSRNVRYRVVASPGWTCSFNLQWDKTIISRNELEAIMHDAGKFCGLGDARAIGMGRFEVAGFSVTDA